MGLFNDVIDANFGPPRPSLIFPCDRGAHSQHADASDDHSFHGRMPKPRRPSNFSLSSWARPAWKRRGGCFFQDFNLWLRHTKISRLEKTWRYFSHLAGANSSPSALAEPTGWRWREGEISWVWKSHEKDVQEIFWLHRCLGFPFGTWAC